MQVFFPNLMGKLVSRFGIRPGPVGEPMGVADLTPITDMDRLSRVAHVLNKVTAITSAATYELFVVPAGERWLMNVVSAMADAAGDYDWQFYIRRVDLAGNGFDAFIQPTVRGADGLHHPLVFTEFWLFPGDAIRVNTTNHVTNEDLTSTVLYEIEDCES